MTKTIDKPESAELVKKTPTISERFQQDVEKQFAAQLGAGRRFSEMEKRLTQHVFLKVDQALKAAEEKRTKGWPAEKLAKATEDARAFTWNHIDRAKLALDTVHRVSLGLDALIPNHIWPVTYFNSAKNLYDVDLRIGYVGHDFVARKHALEAPLSVVYELVFSTDTFKALPRSSSRDSEGYEFEISSPFDRGAIVGGFGYIAFEDPRKNRLVLVTMRDFKRSMDASPSSFWKDNDVEMHYKTVVHRTAAKIALDPAKVNSEALAAVTAAEYDREDAIDVEAKVNANTITIETPKARKPVEEEFPEDLPDELTEEEKAAAIRRDQEEAGLFEPGF